MDIVSLPVPFLTSLSSKLSTTELINLITAVENVSYPCEFENSYLFKLIFNKK